MEVEWVFDSEGGSTLSILEGGDVSREFDDGDLSIIDLSLIDGNESINSEEEVIPFKETLIELVILGHKLSIGDV